MQELSAPEIYSNLRPLGTIAFQTLVPDIPGQLQIGQNDTHADIVRMKIQDRVDKVKSCQFKKKIHSR
jgi:hypothetical protein